MKGTRSRTTGIFCVGAALLVAAFAHPWTLFAQAPQPSKGVKFATISQADTKEWLTYLSSDALQGRQVFTEGYGLAVSYIAEHIRQWGLKPIGDQGYFQSVKYRDYRVTRNSSITVEVNGQSRTFKHGDHVTFAVAAGGKQTLTFDGVDFAGYGIFSQPYKHDDFAGRDVKGKLVMYLAGTPVSISKQIEAAQPPGQAAGRGGRGATLGGNRTNFVTQVLGASAVLTFAAAPAAAAPPTPAEQALASAEAALAQASQAVTEARAQLAGGARGGGRAGGGGGGGGGGRGPAAAAAQPDMRSVLNVNALLTPTISADETFYEFLFSGSPSKFADLRAKATAGEPLPPFSVKAKVTVNIDNTYEVLATQLTKNVVGMIEGTDPKLKDTYVMFGAHLDHVGYRTSAGGGRGGRAGGGGAGGAATGGEPDLISNGADDDGSGTVGLLGIAKAFATGPKPKRSIVFVWHAGEEAGLLGSRYNADFPVVPLEKVQAQLNIDMIGRNRNDDPAQANSVFVIGADRISTDLHNLVVETNSTLAKPVHLDYEYNDPNDSNSFYTRSDHYSYAVKGIPIAFFFTGTHPDYHQVSDSVEKILFPKLTAIAQLVYQTGFNIANTDKVLERDNKGPRSGRGFEGTIKR